MNPDIGATILGGVAAALTYWGSVGFQVPQDKQQVVTLFGSAAIAALGYITNKQGNNGSN